MTSALARVEDLALEPSKFASLLLLWGMWIDECTAAVHQHGACVEMFVRTTPDDLAAKRACNELYLMLCRLGQEKDKLEFWIERARELTPRPSLTLCKMEIDQ